MSTHTPIRHGGRMATVALLAAAVALAATGARAVDPIPDIKFLVHPAVAKDSTPPPGAMAPATIRNTMETVVETWWKEVSYHEADPVTGFSQRGFYPDTKTYGYMWVPWAVKASAGGRPDSYIPALPLTDKENRPVQFGGEAQYEVPPPGAGPAQLYGGSGALVDGYWTPGERFQDQNGNGRWDPAGAVVLGELWWNTDNTTLLVDETLWPGPQEVYGYNGNGSTAAGPDTRGELYADYNGNTVANPTSGRVTTLGFNASVSIFMANGESNATVVLTELDLTPNNNLFATNQPSREGDFVHTQIQPPAGTPTGLNTIPRNGRFDYEINPVNAQLNVFRARSTIDNTPLNISYWRWMTASNTLYTGSQASIDGAVLREVVVPIYQATELFGQLRGVAGSTASYWDGAGGNGVWAPGAVGTPAEPFEDFVSWWVPFAGEDRQGRWVCGILGAPMGIQQPNAAAADPNSWGMVISYNDYTNYIANNYPGDTAALIARAGNGRYDGPDNWAETICNKMRIEGYEGDEGGTRPPRPTTPPPQANGWDPWRGTTWQQWWTNTFSSPPPTHFGSPYAGSGWWDGNGIPRCSPYQPEDVVIAAGAWVPPLQSTWDYDSPREFQDLPSAIYHLGNRDGRGASYAGNPYPGGGDLRLGEVTSPWDEQIFGADLGNGNPSSGTPFADGDKSLACGGPLAFNGFGQASFDAINVLSLEAATWRTDGQSLTGPRAPAASRGMEPQYGGDHRDVNLNGIIELGETVPASSHNYFIDDRVGDESPDGGWTSKDLYPFNWDRYAEDVVEANDYTEDYARAVRYGITTVDEVIDGGAAEEHPHGEEGAAPIEPTIPPGVAGSPLAGVAGRANVPAMGSTVFRPGDSAWIDADGDGRYDADVALNAILAGADGQLAITNGTAGAALTAARLRDVNGNGLFDKGVDDVFVDGGVANVFDSETVLADSGLLRNGLVGKTINHANPAATVVYRDRDGSASLTPGDDVWMEYPLPGATNAVANRFDVTDTLILSWRGLTNGVAGTGPVPSCRYYSRKPSGVPDNGYTAGDDLWIDANVNTRFDSDEVVYRANAFIYTFRDARALTNGTPAAAMAGVVARDLGGGAGFQQGTDEAWQDNTGNLVFGQEVVIADANGLLRNGVARSYPIGNAYYYDANGNGVYNAGTDPVWAENNGDARYAAAANIRLPLYFIVMHSGIGMGLDLSGNSCRVYHRDEQVPLGGYIQVVEAMSLDVLTHEQCHDLLGWPDLYDYDVFDANGYENTPIGDFDLMAGGGMVHGIPDLKYGAGWTRAIDLRAIFPLNSGVHRVFLWPCERRGGQYFYFSNPVNVGERFWFWYQSGVAANPYQNFSSVGGRGVHIEHVDLGSNPMATPAQQRVNDHFTYNMVQADGLYEMEDGIDRGGPDDVWPGTTDAYLFTPDTTPPARWWDQSDAGIRIVNITIPSDPNGPAWVDFEIYDTGVPFIWPVGGTDSDGDGIADVWELFYFGSLTVVSAASDYDGDGLGDVGEFLSRTNPKVARSSDSTEDSDGDGLSNAAELGVHGTLPFDQDTDKDGLKDGTEVALGLQPLVRDDDGDGIDTWFEVMWDGQSGYQPYMPGTGLGGDLNAGSDDSDGDGVSDLMEIAAGSDPLDPSDARELAIGGIGITPDGYPTVSWGTPANDAGMPLTYRLERSANLVNWTNAADVNATGDLGADAAVFDDTAPAAGFYRVTVDPVRQD